MGAVSAAGPVGESSSGTQPTSENTVPEGLVPAPSATEPDTLAERDPDMLESLQPVRAVPPT